MTTSTILSISAYVALAMAAPSAAPDVAPAPAELGIAQSAASLGAIDVDLSGLAAQPGGGLVAADTCGALSPCVGHQCVRIVCCPQRTTIYCVTYRYGPC
ncbi:hypothetical protein B0H63DRAFT_521047 [Podospora didyma]|uniref:Hydrophobin n=1 Tax=Podospora didyma TaxID=330526 RepID=A0AAE0NT34_9PEZI|nr:hypothetical protein B0H63DRAFT_521047 [Podospora didyma]